MLAFGVFYVVDLHVRMVFRCIGHLLECDAVEFVCQREDTFGNRIDSEVGADCVFVEGVFLAAYLFGEIIVIPGCDFEIVAEAV